MGVSISARSNSTPALESKPPERVIPDDEDDDKGDEEEEDEDEEDEEDNEPEREGEYP